MKTFRWGILGCGGIARKFCKSVASLENSTVVACASRTPGKAEAFAGDHHIPRSYSTYEDLLTSDDIDAVYIATTHNFHCENALLALNHGKAVLCEKPLALNEEQVRKMVNCARENEVFLMEAMWSRFLPAIRHVKEWISGGEIGEIQTLRADFCFRTEFNPDGRLFNPDLAGGALLDVGIYPVSMASFLMDQQPSVIRSLADKGETGVDEQSAFVFRYENGALALLSAAIRSRSENRLEVCGTKGRIVIPNSFHGSQTASLIPFHGEKVVVERPFEPEAGFRFEIQAAQEAIQAGANECNWMPLEESIAIAQTMDRIAVGFSEEE